jgi:hypothetical protein
MEVRHLNISWNNKVDLIGQAIYEIIIPVEEVRNALDELLKVLSQQVRVEGFRQGKAPRNLIIERAGHKIVENSLKQHLHSEAFNELLKHITVKSVGPPSFKAGDRSPLDLESPYIFEVEFNKHAGPVDPKHGKQMPVMGNFSGGPIEVRERMLNEAGKNRDISEHLPEEISKSLPERILTDARSQIEAFRDPVKLVAHYEVEPGKTDVAEIISKVAEPEDLIVNPPHETLDKKAEVPQKDLDDQLPKTDYKPETHIETPEAELSTDPKELGVAIESPMQTPADLPHPQTQEHNE